MTIAVTITAAILANQHRTASVTIIFCMTLGWVIGWELAGIY